MSSPSSLWDNAELKCWQRKALGLLIACMKYKSALGRHSCRRDLGEQIIRNARDDLRRLSFDGTYFDFAHAAPIERCCYPNLDLSSNIASLQESASASLFYHPPCAHCFEPRSTPGRCSWSPDNGPNQVTSGHRTVHLKFIGLRINSDCFESLSKHPWHLSIGYSAPGRGCKCNNPSPRVRRSGVHIRSPNGQGSTRFHQSRSMQDHLCSASLEARSA